MVGQYFLTMATGLDFSWSDLVPPAQTGLKRMVLTGNLQHPA